MLQVTYRLTLGRDEFELKAEVKNEKEFFEIMSFYSNLPRTAPGGADDLKVVFRTTKDGYKYYSLVSEKEKMEYRFGQNTENNGNGLFPKGWEKLYEKDNETQTNATSVAPVGAQAPRAAVAPTAVQNPVASQPAAAQPAATAPQATQQRSAQAANVLSRFGINN